MQIDIFTLSINIKERKDERTLIDENDKEWVLIGTSTFFDDNGFPSDVYAITKINDVEIGGTIHNGKISIGSSDLAKLYYESVLETYIKPIEKYPTVKCNECGYVGEAKSYMAPDFLGDKKQRIGTCYYICSECGSPNIENV
jgi:hypothetical protein